LSIGQYSRVVNPNKKPALGWRAGNDGRGEPSFLSGLGFLLSDGRIGWYFASVLAGTPPVFPAASSPKVICQPLLERVFQLQLRPCFSRTSAIRPTLLVKLLITLLVSEENVEKSINTIKRQPRNAPTAYPPYGVLDTLSVFDEEPKLPKLLDYV